MLPGFRFLLAAIVLSISILIFGLGAAALLRAAHEEFAGIPSRRTLPEPVFAQRGEMPAPTLALLRVEPAVVEKAPENARPASAAAEQPPEAVPVPPVVMEMLAALTTDDSAPSQTTKVEMPAAAPSTEAAPVQAETPASIDEAKVANVEQVSQPAVAVVAAPALQPVIVPPAPESRGVATRIATRGGPAATVEAPASAKPSRVKPGQSEIQKQERAERAKEERRRQVRRARLLARQAAAALLLQQQQQADPFAPALQPAIATAPRPTIATARKKR
jgi:hypothetical protein